MTFREFFLENFADDLEYHPRRALLYLILGAGSIAYFGFIYYESKATTTSEIFILGGIALMIKGFLLLRKSSEGLGLTLKELADLSISAKQKPLPSLPNQAAQLLQDFGVGPLLISPPLLVVAKDFEHPWSKPVHSSVFIAGLVLFGLGWLIRRLTSNQ
jgi:hypothetical protein